MASIATLRDLTEALIESAKDENKLDKVTADIESVYDLVSAHDELKGVLTSTTYELGEREAIVSDIGERAGLDKLTKNFLNIVLELDKIKSFLGSKQSILRKLRKASGIIRAEIITAEQPTDDELNRLKSSISKLVGSEVHVTSVVDPTIIGGMIAKVEDKVFDGSIKTQLERIRTTLLR